MIFLYCRKRGSSPEANPIKGVSQYFPRSIFRRFPGFSRTKLVIALFTNFSGSFTHVILFWVSMDFSLTARFTFYIKKLALMKRLVFSFAANERSFYLIFFFGQDVQSHDNWINFGLLILPCPSSFSSSEPSRVALIFSAL